MLSCELPKGDFPPVTVTETCTYPGMRLRQTSEKREHMSFVKTATTCGDKTFLPRCTPWAL